MLPSLGTIWAGVWLLLAAPSADASTLSSLTAVAAIALLATLTAGAMRRAAATSGVAPVPTVGGGHVLRQVHVPPRLCDPDAAGRPRPRAPSAGPAA